MLTLLYAPGACSLAPHIVLEWIGTQYEARRVELGSPELLEFNPSGAVPVIIDDKGWSLTQAGAVLDYLIRRFPEADIDAPPSIEAQAQKGRWSSFLTGDLHPAYFPVFSPQRYTTETGDAALAAVREAGRRLVRRQLHFIDDHLEGRQWFVAGKRTVIDAYAFPMVRWATSLLPEKLSEHPNVSAFFERMRQDAAVMRVMKDEGLLEK